MNKKLLATLSYNRITNNCWLGKGNFVFKMDANSKNCVTDASAKFRKLCKISALLNTGLNPTQLYLCQKLIKKGVSPEALAHSVKAIRDELKKVQPQ